MRKYSFFSILICISFVMLIYSCEKADLTTTSNVALNGQLTNRTVASCDQCPVGACCCSVEPLVQQGSLSLRFCGTADGTPGCTDTNGPSPCNSISGGGQTISLNSMSGWRKLYCMYPGNAFSIKNQSGTNVTIIISCQHDLTNPQKDTISINNNDTVWFSTDTGCAVAQCL